MRGRVCGLLVAVAAAVTLAGCGTVHPTVAELRALPGATASYPGSVAIDGPGGHEGSNTLWAHNPSQFGALYCTTETESEVVQWFADQLAADGWEQKADPARTGTDQSAEEAWDRGDRNFRLLIMSEAYTGHLKLPPGQSCPVAYTTITQ